MLQLKTFICQKCGKCFSVMVGGIVQTPRELNLYAYPLCSKCKLSKIAKIFK